MEYSNGALLGYIAERSAVPALRPEGPGRDDVLTKYGASVDAFSADRVAEGVNGRQWRFVSVPRVHPFRLRYPQAAILVRTTAILLCAADRRFVFIMRAAAWDFGAYAHIREWRIRDRWMYGGRCIGQGGHRGRTHGLLRVAQQFVAPGT